MFQLIRTSASYSKCMGRCSIESKNNGANISQVCILSWWYSFQSSQCALSATYWGMYLYQVYKLGGNAIATLSLLSLGSERKVKCYNKYFVNGYMFHTEEYG